VRKVVKEGSSGRYFPYSHLWMATDPVAKTLVFYLEYDWYMVVKVQKCEYSYIHTCSLKEVRTYFQP
jgi:hypothetical protein